jgi:hypothetical protein
VIPEYFGVNSGPISILEIRREQDFRVLYVIPLHKATDESKNDGFPKVTICRFNGLPGADQTKSFPQGGRRQRILAWVCNRSRASMIDI